MSQHSKVSCIKPAVPASRTEPRSRLDVVFAVPGCAVIFAIACNVLWGTAFPFIKLGYRLFGVDTARTASILRFAGTRFMLGGFLVYAAGSLLHRRLLMLPRGRVLAECCALGLCQTTLQYFFYYLAVARLTGALGSILNSSASFFAVILSHFLYGSDDCLTPRKALGCALGFAGVVAATFGAQSGGSVAGMVLMLCAAVVAAVSGPWNKRLTHLADGFAVCAVNLVFGGFLLLLLGLAGGGTLQAKSDAAVPVLLYLAFVSAAGYVLQALLMKNNPVSRISVFGLLIPVVTTLLSAVLNGEPLFRWQYLAALALVCAGIVLVNRPGGKAAPHV